MTVLKECRAKIPAICRVHGVNFVSTINTKTGTFLHNPANNPEQAFKDSQNYRLLLNKKEQAALSAYANQDYTKIGEHVYGKQEHEVSQLMQSMDSALKKHEKIAGSNDKVVYRATKLFNEKFTTPEEAASYVNDKFKVGEEITINGYMSTTANPEALFDFMPQSYEDLPPSTGMFGFKDRAHYAELNQGYDAGLSNIVYEIETPSGAPLASFGHAHADKEQEYLLGRNKSFIVLEVIPNQLLINPNEQTHASIKKKHATVVRLKEVMS